MRIYVSYLIKRCVSFYHLLLFAFGKVTWLHYTVRICLYVLFSYSLFRIHLCYYSFFTVNPTQLIQIVKEKVREISPQLTMNIYSTHTVPFPHLLSLPLAPL